MGAPPLYFRVSVVQLIRTSAYPPPQGLLVIDTLSRPHVCLAIQICLFLVGPVLAGFHFPFSQSLQRSRQLYVL